MNLRNKKTGGKGYLYANKDANYNVLDADDKVLAVYPSLAELSEDWEDYEEPVKPYWFINDLDGEPMKCDLKNCGKSNFVKWGEHRKQIGNYFETQEEAEKAVEKLKAWKRLKDKGFKFNDYHIPAGEIYFDMEIPKGSLDEIAKDLDLLFGGEE